MDDSSSVPLVWTLNGEFGQLEGRALEGKVNVALPNFGLNCVALDHGSAACRLLSTHRAFESKPDSPPDSHRRFSSWPIEVAETYVRGNDLVATYHPIDEWPYAPQLYWCAKTLESVEGTLGSLSLLISVQTHLLDTHPRIQVQSYLPNSEMLLFTVAENGAANVESVTVGATIARDVDPGGAMYGVLWRPAASPVSYVEIASASDIRRIEVALARDQTGTMLSTWHLFAEFLEKGVIRRARVHGALLPRANDTELAFECCQTAQQCPLPLTT